MKISLCGQYWYKYDSSVNIEDSLLFIHENMQEHVQCYGIVQNVEYDYLKWLYFVLLFLLCSW